MPLLLANEVGKMLKKVPYNSQLVSIGNVNHYSGQPVYTDGRVAYGWQYNYSNKPGGMFMPSGFWTNSWRAPASSSYEFPVLMKDDLTFSTHRAVVSGFDDGAFFCYPWVASYDYDAQAWVNKTFDKSYTFSGSVVAMSNDGKLLTYIEDLTAEKPYRLCQWDNNGSIIANTDITELYGEYSSGFLDVFAIEIKGAQYEHRYTPSDLPFQLATVDGCYITVRDNPNPDDPSATSSLLTFYAGDGSVSPASIPSTVQLSDVAVLRTSDLGLIIDGHTYAGDPLGLLPPDEYNTTPTNTSGVHAFNNIILSQQEDRYPYMFGRIFKDGQSITSGTNDYFNNCFSLAKLPGGRWIL